MPSAEPSYQWPDGRSECSTCDARSDELQSLRIETKRLRELVVQLSKLAIRNVAEAK
jgi:hypothetical protein